MKIHLTFFLLLFCALGPVKKYPVSGYEMTGIRRLAYLKKIVDGEVQGRLPPPGALKSWSEIELNLLGSRGDSLEVLPPVDTKLQNSINSIFPNLDESYSITVLDISPGKPMRFAKRQENKGFQPGSVGKLAIITGLFSQLEKLYPNSFRDRQELLKTTFVRAGSWAIPNQHTIPFYFPETGEYYRRLIQEKDVFSLYEWADHMLSVSSNGAASVVWREVMLMAAFGNEYPVTEERSNEYFKNTPKSQLSRLAMSVVNEPLRQAGIGETEWRLGSLFTRGAKAIVPGEGGSLGTPVGLMKFLIALERGKLIDQSSSLEIKRLMYMTDRRIRYGGAAVLSNAALYFKSGSLYKCKPEEGYNCVQYQGNANNFMNSVAIIEHTDNTIYMVVLMSNVLKKNSGSDHYGLATQIDRIIRRP